MFSWKNWPEPGVVRAIAEKLRANRSSNEVRALSKLYNVTEDFVEKLANHVANETFDFGPTLITESAPPKGPTMRTLKNLRPNESSELIRALRTKGTSAPVLASLRAQYLLGEADMSALAQAVTESGAKPKATLTEMAPTVHPNAARFVYEAAVDLQKKAARAEADLTGATIQELEALTALSFGPRAFRN